MEHSFDVGNATKYGIEEAIFIKSMAFWIIKNRANGKHLIDNRTWTYNSHKAFKDIFPYMNESKIKRVIESLVNQEVLVKGNYNKSGYDRTCWYAFKDEQSIIGNGLIHLSKMENGKDENDGPIPYSNTINNTYTKTYKEIPINILFDDWWSLYDKKVGNKSKLEQKWNKLTDDQRTQAISHTREYIKAQPEKQYRKNPDTYLNNEAYYDEIIKPKVFYDQVPTNKITTQIKLP